MAPQLQFKKVCDMIIPLDFKEVFTMLELKNLSFTAQSDNGKAEILKDISLTIPDRRFVVITGPNGGGKTTLAKAIMGLVPATSGSIFWNGEDITN